MVEKLITKNDLLNKLRAYRTTPDDENIQYKKKIKKDGKVVAEKWIPQSMSFICTQ